VLKRTLLLISLLGASAYATVISNIQTTIDDINANSAKAIAKEAKVGMSGVIIHTFENSQSAIIAKATVLEKKPSGELTLSVETYTPTAQKTLPYGEKSAVTGDKLILGYAYNRAMIIAESSEAFQKIKNMKQQEWVHPDLFATELSTSAQGTPTKDAFTLFCQVNTIGLVYFHINDNLHTVDCSTFNILESENFSSSSESKMKPFYNRIGEIHTSWLGWFSLGSTQISDYTEHFNSLIGTK